MSAYKTVTANGELVDFKITVNGDQFAPCPNSRVTFTIPSGVRLTGPSNAGSVIINVPKGFYNNTSKIWTIGDLAVGEKVENTFQFTVDNIALADEDDNRFIIGVELESACTETSSTDNVTNLVIEVVDPCTQVSLDIGIDDDASAVSSADLSIG